MRPTANNIAAVEFASRMLLVAYFHLVLVLDGMFRAFLYRHPEIHFRI